MPSRVYYGFFSLVLISLIAVSPGHGQSIPNPSFEEAHSFTVSPGYGGGTNGSIPGWIFSSPIASGLNPVSGGGAPFANNGAIPDGSTVAFIQSVSATADSQLSTTISGLTIGQTYRVSFRANARLGNEAILRVYLDYDYANPLPVSRNYARAAALNVIQPVGGTNPYHVVSFAFIATGTSHAMTIRNAQSGDNTLLIDAFTIAPEVITTSPWTDDASSGIDLSSTLWVYNFGGSENASVNGVTVLPIAQPNGALDNAHFTLVGPSQRLTDTNQISSSGSDPGTARLASSFFYGGNPQTKLTLKNLDPGTRYTLSILTVGWGLDTSPAARAQTFTTSDGVQRTLSPGEFFQGYGTRIDIPFLATAETHEITATVANANGASLHLYGLALSSDVLLVTHEGTSGPGSLSQAMETARLRPGPDRIVFSPALDGAEIYVEPMGDSSSSTVAFIISDLNEVTLSALDLPNGLTLRPASRFTSGFTIRSGSTLHLEGITLRAFAGAVFSDGTFNAVRCSFIGNGATPGGALFNRGVANLSQCTFEGNYSPQGGAILNGGINLPEGFVPGVLTIDQSTFSSNRAGTSGGAILNTGTLHLSRSTLHDNRAQSGSGGAIQNQGSVTLFHCTVAENLAATEGGAILSFFDEAAFTVLPAPSVKIINSILAYNAAPAGPNLQILDGTLGFEGGLLIDDMEGSGVTNLGDGTYSIAVVDPLLALLADYGGPTLTMALRGVDNPARDRAPVYEGHIQDQRGLPVLGPPDIGAYEGGSAVNYADHLAESLPQTGPASGVAPWGDFDGDGVSNEDEEFKFGTDMTDPDSVFRPVLVNSAPNAMDLSFLAVRSFRYTLQYWDHPNGIWTTKDVFDTNLIEPEPPLTLAFAFALDYGDGLYRIVVDQP